MEGNDEDGENEGDDVSKLAENEGWVGEEEEEGERGQFTRALLNAEGLGGPQKGRLRE